MILKDIEYLVTQNREREVLEDRDIRVRDGMIEEIGVNLSGDNETDFSGKAVMPGLINAHTHSPMTLLRGISDDKPLQPWLEEDIFSAESNLDGVDIYLGTLLAAAEMLSTGTTTFNEMYFQIDQVARAVEDSGMRAVLAYGMIDEDSSAAEELAGAAEICAGYSGKEMIDTAVAPHSPYNCSEELLIDSKKYADSRDLPYHIHVSETESEVENMVEKRGMRPVEYLFELGLLDSNTVIAHGTHLSEEEVRLLEKAGTSAVHNPSANLKLGSGIMDLGLAMEKGVNVSLGTDGPASNNSLNMFDEMKTAALLHKRSDPGSIEAQEVMDMSTVNAAEALGLEDRTGSLEEGKRADLVAIDLERPDTAPVTARNIISHLVYSFSGEVSDVFVDGKHLLRDGEHANIDLGSLIRKARLRRLSKIG